MHQINPMSMPEIKSMQIKTTPCSACSAKHLLAFNVSCFDLLKICKNGKRDFQNHKRVGGRFFYRKKNLNERPIHKVKSGQQLQQSIGNVIVSLILFGYEIIWVTASCIKEMGHRDKPKYTLKKNLPSSARSVCVWSLWFDIS